MKNFPILCFLLFCVQFSSCSTDETINRALFDEQQSDPTASNPDDTTVDDTTTDDTTTDDTVEEVIITATETCFIQDIEFLIGEPTKIDCLLDLEGETVNVPENVILEFDGGDIFNGTLNFSSLGKIDGKLLNSNLVVEGDVVLVSEEFVFYVDRWDIVEGKTTSDIAQGNNDELERLMEYAKSLGAISFKIDKIDAYFQIHYPTLPFTFVFHPSIEGIRIPSDFNLIMTDNTHLRVYPGVAENESGVLLSLREVENVSITGGVLHGDRDEREYPVDTAGSAGSHLLRVYSGKNIIIDGITFVNGSAGSLNVASIGFTFNPDTYNPSENITIENCIFKNSRRMSIALTDGRDINILNNTFIDTDQDSVNSKGGEVGYAINIEATRTRDSNTGELIEYEKVFDVLISGNTETGSRGGALAVTIGQTVTVEGNTFDSQVVLSHTNGTKITGNTFKALSAESADRFAIFIGDGGVTAYDNEIIGNTISGYDLAIATNGNEAIVNNNIISNCVIGLQIGKSKNSEFNNNDISTTGHAISATNSFVENATLKNNRVSTEGNFSVYFAQVNQGDEYIDNRILLEGNTFTNFKTINFTNSNGIIYRDNLLEGGIQVGNSSNVEIWNNKEIRPSEKDGIRIYGDNTSIILSGNTVYEPLGAVRFVCINNDSDDLNEVLESNNTCN